MSDYTSAATVVNRLSSRLISAQSIAKARLQPRQRARLAADWVDGSAQIKPTIALAARVLRVSVPLIYEALKHQRNNGNGTSAPTALVRLSQAWDRATPAERAAFGRAIGVDVIWDDAIALNLD
jgi:hypothetical protein